MAAHTDVRDEPRTPGTGQREPRDLDASLRRIEIADVAQRLRREDAFATDGRNAETIHDDGMVRAIVSVLAEGRDIGARESVGYVAITISEGRGLLRRGEEESEAVAGSVAILAPGAPWAFVAIEPCTLFAVFWGF
jgi:quercetin dioxygenase-like cupin family protein